MKLCCLARIFPALFLLACSDRAQIISGPASKRVSSPFTISAPVAGTAENAKPRKPAHLIVVSGTIQNPNGITYSSNARVAGLWSGDVGEGDFGYIFGSGKIDQEAGTFRMELHADPPDSASFGGIFGVGVLIVWDGNGELEEGLFPEEFWDSDAVVGASPRHQIIWSSRDPELLENIPWIEPFPKGYSVGRGIDVPDYTFDGFEPVGPGIVEIILDDLGNLDFVNWT